MPLSAAALFLHDIGINDALSTQAKAAIEGMWKEKRADGAWNWLDFDLEPSETRLHSRVRSGFGLILRRCRT